MKTSTIAGYRAAQTQTFNEKMSPKNRIFCGLVLGLLLAATGHAWSASIYWSEFDGGTIRRANLDGSARKLLVGGLSLPVGPVIDLDAGTMYWGDAYGDVRRANLDGTAQKVLVSTSGGCPALDLAGGKMYWNDPGAGVIRRANLDGTDQIVLVTGLNNPHAVVLDLTHNKVYWPNFGGGSLQRADLDGRGKTNLVQGLASPSLMTLDIAAGKMYWTGQGSGDIRRANLDGSSQETLIKGLNAPSGIALDVSRGQIYWAEYGGGTIGRSNLDGSGKTNLFRGLSGPSVVTLDLSPLRTPDIVAATKSHDSCSVSWSALMGRSYQVQFRNSLTQTNWTNSGGARTATNVTMTASSNVGADPQRFFRVVLLP